MALLRLRLGGDVFGYVEHQENIDFRDAVELLADKYHIELHYDKADNVPAHTGSKRARLLEANEAAQEYFAFICELTGEKAGDKS